jgi:small subunit ribosomal protein S1
MIVLLLRHMLGLDIVEGIKQNRDPFSIARAENNGHNIFLSRRKLLEQVQQKVKKKFPNSLTVGTVFTGTVTCLMPYCAFVELISGVDEMVHISELSWSRIENSEEVVRSGDTAQSLSNNY